MPPGYADVPVLPGTRSRGFLKTYRSAGRPGGSGTPFRGAGHRSTMIRGSSLALDPRLPSGNPPGCGKTLSEASFETASPALPAAALRRRGRPIISNLGKPRRRSLAPRRRSQSVFGKYSGVSCGGAGRLASWRLGHRFLSHKLPRRAWPSGPPRSQSTLRPVFQTRS